jgi:hypothetical protein
VYVIIVLFSSLSHCLKDNFDIAILSLPIMSIVSSFDHWLLNMEAVKVISILANADVTLTEENTRVRVGFKPPTLMLTDKHYARLS